MPRVPIAIISNSQTPYRLHLHKRIAEELPQIQLHSVYTHETSNSTWEFEAPPEIGPILFGKGESSQDQDKLAGVVKEWHRGGKIIRWMKQTHIKFVLMMGYNDAGRMRIIRWCNRNNVALFLFGDSNIHGDIATGLKAIVKRRVVSRIVAQCAGVLPCGSLGRTYFLKYGARPDRIFYYPYEPDYHLIESITAEQIAAVKNRFAMHEKRRRLVYSGRLMHLKRVDLLLAGFIAIAKQRPDWDVMVIGDGPDRDRLKVMIPPELTQRVQWAGFLDDQETVSAIYRACDVLVLPSDYEPWALVVNEAAAAGMAIISSNVVGRSAEIVRDGVNGRLFSPGDLAALTSALLDVTDDLVVDRMKRASPDVLADWRKRGDPVVGLRKALESVAILPAS